MKCIECGKDASYIEKNLFGTKQYGICNNHMNKYLKAKNKAENKDFGNKMNMIPAMIGMAALVFATYFLFTLLVGR